MGFTIVKAALDQLLTVAFKKYILFRKEHQTIFVYTDSHSPEMKHNILVGHYLLTCKFINTISVIAGTVNID